MRMENWLQAEMRREIFVVAVEVGNKQLERRRGGGAWELWSVMSSASGQPTQTGVPESAHAR